VLQSGCDVDLFAALGHAVQDHVDEDIGSSSTHSVTAMDADGTGPSTVRLVDFSSELEKSFC